MSCTELYTELQTKLKKKLPLMVCFWSGTLHSQKNLCPVSPIESTSTHGLSYNLGLSSSSGMKVVKQFSAKPPFGCLSKLKENHIIYKFLKSSSVFPIIIQAEILEPVWCFLLFESHCDLTSCKIYITLTVKPNFSDQRSQLA